jgi:putative transposase
VIKVLKAVKVRLYPTPEQQVTLSRSFGCARWYWNYALMSSIQHYQETGKTLKLAVYKGMLPQLKKENPWLKEDCYSAVRAVCSNQSQQGLHKLLCRKGEASKVQVFAR